MTCTETWAMVCAIPQAQDRSQSTSSDGLALQPAATVAPITVASITLWQRQDSGQLAIQRSPGVSSDSHAQSISCSLQIKKQASLRRTEVADSE